MTVEYPLAHLKISSGSIDEMLSSVEKMIEENRKSSCISLNLTKYAVSKKDMKLKDVINSAYLVLPDGAPIVWFSRRLGYRNVHRITGIEFAEEVISRSRGKGWKLFFLGSRPEIAEGAVENLKEQFGDPDIVGHHHGYFKHDEVDRIIDAINDSGADILLLGMGMPQKEYFIYDYSGRINAKLFLPVGGAFDVWAGTKARPPKTVQKAGLEWLYRSIKDKSKAIGIARYGLVFLKDFLFYKW
jgi:N-acetylglucosaminyldiphosphoundecaprenol N-acetyl-beta-D-mannosaminyltransferase